MLPARQHAAAQRRSGSMCSSSTQIAIEHLWALMMSGQAIVNPAQADCLCWLYSLCLPP